MNDDKERDDAKARVKDWIDKPEHAHGKPDQIEATRDDSLTDPKHNEGKDE